MKPSSFFFHYSFFVTLSSYSSYSLVNAILSSGAWCIEHNKTYPGTSFLKNTDSVLSADDRKPDCSYIKLNKENRQENALRLEEMLEMF